MMTNGSLFFRMLYKRVENNNFVNTPAVACLLWLLKRTENNNFFTTPCVADDMSIALIADFL